MATGMDPFADLLTLQRDMDRIMTKFGGQARMTGDEERSFWMPSVDVFKQGNDMMLRVELPGVNPSDINVAITGNMLTIKGERRQDRQIDENDYVMRESTYGSFERRMTLPEEIDAGQVRAQYRAGILEITIPSSAMITAQPRNVQVVGAGTQSLGSQAAPQAGYMGGQQQEQYAGGQGGYGEQGQGMQGTRQPEYTGSQQYGQGTGTGYASSQQTQSGYGTDTGLQQPSQTGATYGQPMSQTSGETRGREEGAGAQAYGQEPQPKVEGGWVSQSGQQGGQQGEERSEDDEHGHRTKLGGWLHGDK